MSLIAGEVIGLCQKSFLVFCQIIMHIPEDVILKIFNMMRNIGLGMKYQMTLVLAESLAA